MLSSILRSAPDGCGDYYTNKGICLGTELWIFLLCFLYTVISIVYFVASYIDKIE